jgi:hypothetical protein
MPREAMSEQTPISQLSPYIPDHVPRLFLEPFKISQADVKDALAGPVQVESIVMGGQTITLIRSPARANRPHSSLLVGGEIYQTAFSVEYALRVPDSLAPSPEEAATPFRTLEAIANACGFELNIGQRRAKFIKDELIRLTTETNINYLTVHSYPGAVEVSSSWVRVFENGGRKIAQVALCFVLDAAAYKQAIGV